MFRLAVNIHLMLAILAGPGFCCCTQTGETAQKSLVCQSPKHSAHGDSDAPARCACHREANSGDSDVPRPEKCPACPCKQQREVLAQAGATDLHIANSLSSHVWDLHRLPAIHFAPAALSVSGAGIADVFIEAVHPTGREILCAHCVLRC